MAFLGFVTFDKQFLISYSFISLQYLKEQVDKNLLKTIFDDDENIPLVTHHDKGGEDYNTPNASKVDETTFTTSSSTNKQATSILRLSQKVKRDKLAALYRHLNVTGSLDLINLD